MKTTMKKLTSTTSAVAIGLFALSALARAADCPKGANASLNLKTFTCESSINPPTISRGMLTATGVLKAANSGKGSARISNVVANLQIRDGNQWITLANAVVTSCSTGAAITCSGSVSTSAGASLSATVPVTVGAFTGTACAPESTANIPFTVMFPAGQLVPGKGARIEFVVTHDAAVSGCANNGCVDRLCGFNRDILIRFGFPVPPSQ